MQNRKQENKLYEEKVNLLILIMAILMVCIGIVLAYVSALFEDLGKRHEIWRAVIQELSGSLFITGAITSLWELIVKRAFLNEILDKVKISKEIAASGIIEVSNFNGIDWKTYLSTNINKLDIFFAYAYSWRHDHVEELKGIAANKNAQIRIVLPDYNNPQIVNELARRFNYSESKLIDKIKEAEIFFENLHPSTSKGASVNIWLLPTTPQFTFYRLDNIAIIALYSHRRELTTVPAIVCKKGGMLYDYICNEFNSMIDLNGLAKPVTEEEK